MAKKLTQEEFINNSIKKWGKDKFNYKNVKYVNSRAVVVLICNKHNSAFLQKAVSHIRYNGCVQCYLEILSKSCTLNNDEFLQRFKKIWGDTYDLSKITYKGMDKLNIVFCNKHGYFEKDGVSLIRKIGCQLCAQENCKQGAHKTHETFVKSAIQKHGKDKYDYSLDIYVHNQQKIKIKCNICGNIFFQKPSLHLQSKGCMVCWRERNKGPKLNSRLSLQECKERTYNHFGDSITFVDIVLNGVQNKIKLYCNNCNTGFMQYPCHLMRGVGCRNCSESKGEKNISKTINKLNIEFIKQKKINECRSVCNNMQLPFDFYLPNQKILIEYDGEQHFKPVRFAGMTKEKALINYERGKINDQIKDAYAKENNIKLLRIPYTEFKNIEKILTDVLVNNIMPEIKYPEKQ